MGTVLVLIGIVLLLCLYYWLTGKANEKVRRDEEKRFRESLPIGVYHAEDVEWAERMLEMGGVKKEVDLLCSCGYAEECAMHCNHEQHPDCTGPNYFVLNNIKPQTPDLIIDPITDTVIMTKAQADELKWQVLVETEKARAKKDKTDAFKQKMIDRHQKRLKELYGAKQLELPFGEKERMMEDLMKSVTRLEKELLRLQRYPMPLVDQRRRTGYTLETPTYERIRR